MSPKELQYVSDALSHAKFLSEQFSSAAAQVSDPKLKNSLEAMAETHRRTFSSFYSLV